MSQWRTPKHDDLAVRALLGSLLFTADDFNKKAKVCSGGEKNRLLFGKLMMSDINVLIMDEPTNHMDMEAIEALNNALKKFDGTLIFVSHDREFVSSLATRVTVNVIRYIITGISLGLSPFLLSIWQLQRLFKMFNKCGLYLNFKPLYLFPP
jgi:ATPase subunit of ABC transporter with duplicated ATPase domains